MHWLKVTLAELTLDLLEFFLEGFREILFHRDIPTLFPSNLSYIQILFILIIF